MKKNIQSVLHKELKLLARLKSFTFTFLFLISFSAFADDTLGFQKVQQLEAASLTEITSSEHLDDVLTDQPQNFNTADNFISVTNPKLFERLVKKWSSLSKIPNLTMVNINGFTNRVLDKTPKAKQALKNQVEFYKENKSATLMLSILTANSAVNWIFFSSGTTAETKAMIIAINAVLYAVLGTNIPNWRKVLGFAQNKFQKIQKYKLFSSLTDDSIGFASSSATNFAYYFIYTYSIQGLLNLNDLDRLMSFDLFNLVVTTSVFGVFSSGFWDPVFEKLVKTNKISESKIAYLYYMRAIGMGILGNLAAMGVSQSYYVMGLSGAAASLAMVFQSEKSEVLLKKLTGFVNFNKIHKAPSFYFSKAQVSMSCKALL